MQGNGKFQFEAGLQVEIFSGHSMSNHPKQ